MHSIRPSAHRGDGVSSGKDGITLPRAIKHIIFIIMHCSPLKKGGGLGTKMGLRSILLKGFLFLSLFWVTFGLLPGQHAFANTQGGAEYRPQSQYLSPVKTSPFLFTGLGVSWHQKIPDRTSAQILVKFKDKGLWTEWYEVDADIDGKKSADHEYPASFIPVNATDTFQYKVILQTKDSTQTPLVEDIEFTYINSGGGLKTTSPTEKLVATLAPTSTLAAASTKPVSKPLADGVDFTQMKIIARSEWGADESLRIYNGKNPEPVLVKEENDFTEKFKSELKIIRTVSTNEQGNQLTWPLQYPEKISKIVIHHTATTKDLTDPKKAIRDIYYWHAISRGWGDIGYNYLIDTQGNIYEGRAGGDAVVGGHAGRGNIGSIGIAVLGNYQENEVPEPVFRALVALIKAKTKQHAIDPTGSSMFRGEQMPNILGHRDVMSTSCPGEKLFGMLPLIRTSAKSGLKVNIINRGTSLEVNKKYDFQVVGEIPFPSFEPGGKQELVFQIKNSGATSWGAGTFFGLSKNENAVKYLTLDAGSIKSMAVTSEVKPGGMATFKIPLQGGFIGGLSTIEFYPMINGTVKVEKYLSVPVQIKSAVYDFEVQKLDMPQKSLKKGMMMEVGLTLKNTGNVTWKRDGNGKFALGTDQPRDHVNQLLQKPGTRLAGLVEKEVLPGQIGHFKIKIKAPAIAGSYQEFFTPVIEGVNWFPSKNTKIDLVVYERDYQAKLSGTVPSLEIKPGSVSRVSIQLQNIGGLDWQKNGKRKVTLTGKGVPTIQNVLFQEDKVEPGKTATIVFDIKAPLKEGNYPLRLFPRIGAENLLPRQISMNIQVGKNATTKGNSSMINGTKTSTTTSKSSEKPIRIDLEFTGNPVISANGTFFVQTDDGTSLSFAKDEKVSVTYGSNQYTLESGSRKTTTGKPPRFTTDNILRIDNWDRRPSWAPAINDHEFRGVIEVNWYQGRFHTINELPLEDYLKGLGEIDEKQPKEKIRTIIILARTYANFYMKSAEKFPGAPFHLTDDPATSQKYLGYGFEKRSPNTVQAVKDTLGQIVTYQGKLIKTPYFSADDGRTRSALEVWGWKDTPYLESVPDPYCSGKTMNGHGVGLSGCGSLGMAQAGKKYEDIIKYYYKGVEITKM